MTSPVKALLPDPWRAGIDRGWHVIDASLQQRDLDLECDVAIVGTGAGGGTTAEILAHAGLRVILVEEGPLKTSADFWMHEAEAYPDLYQESAARKTKDKAINILQGRCVGRHDGQLTSSFRTPDATLAYWQRAFGLTGFSSADMAPWFARMEARLSIAPGTCRPTPTTKRRPRRREDRHPRGRDPPQRQGLLEHRLLRLGVPDERQAVDAGDDDSRCARPRRDAHHTSPRTRIRPRPRTRHRALLRRDGYAGRAHDGTPDHRPRPRVCRGGRRDRYAGAAVAQPRP
jgi:choline dehydrogenase-like flavoprotein